MLFKLFFYVFCVGTTTKDKTTTMKRPITETSTTENDQMTTTTTYPDENTGRTESREITTEKSTTISSINTETSVSTTKETPEPEISTKATEEPTKETPKPEISTKSTEEPTTELGNFKFFFLLNYSCLCSTSKMANLGYACQSSASLGRLFDYHLNFRLIIIMQIN